MTEPLSTPDIHLFKEERFGSFTDLTLVIKGGLPNLEWKLENGIVFYKAFEKHICTIVTPDEIIIDSPTEFEIKFDSRENIITQPNQPNGTYTLHGCVAKKAKFVHQPGSRLQCIYLEGTATRYSFDSRHGEL